MQLTKYTVINRVTCKLDEIQREVEAGDTVAQALLKCYKLVQSYPDSTTEECLIAVYESWISGKGKTA